MSSRSLKPIQLNCTSVIVVLAVAVGLSVQTKRVPKHVMHDIFTMIDINISLRFNVS
ncbi:protein of unknown function [Caballeronia sp. S22]